MTDVADNKSAIDHKGIEVKLAVLWRVEAEHFVRRRTAPLTGLNHARAVGPILEQARPIDVGR